MLALTGAGAAGAGAAAGISGLVASWGLGEAGTGARADRLGISNLTNNGGCTQGTGPAGTTYANGTVVAVSGPKTLSCLHNSQIDMLGSFSISGWASGGFATGAGGIITKDDAGSNREWGAYASGNTLNFYLYDTSGTQRNLSVPSFSSVYHFFGLWYDDTAKTINGFLDGNWATPTSTSTGNKFQTGKTAPLTLGAFGGGGNPLDATLAEFNLFNKVLSAGEWAKLQSGEAYPYL